MSVKEDDLVTARAPHGSQASSWKEREASRPSSGPDVSARQTTLGRPVSCRGPALHSGIEAELFLIPAPADTGIRFQRSDLPGAPSFRLSPERVVDTRLSTVVAAEHDPSLRVATIEHLMAALHALGIDNVLIAVNGPELPVLDGCSEAFVSLIQRAGTATLDVARRHIALLKTVRVEGRHGSFAELGPSAEGLSLSVSIDFAVPAIGRQHYSTMLDERRFLDDIAFCRTFVERKDIEALQEAGLARGGSLANAIVVDGSLVLNPEGLRTEDEFVRHKLLDAIGDLYCAGHRLQARFTGHKSGHELNNALLRAVFADPENWGFVSQGRQPAKEKLRRDCIAA